jgi:predicted RNase H-like nuclease (RuvC/YqgF family)
MHDERMETLASMVAQTSPRLDNIERSIGRMETTLVDLSKAMVSIARVEERLASNYDQVTHLHKEVAQLKGQLQGLMEKNANRDANNASSAEKVRWMERAGWLVFAGLVSYAFAKDALPL